VAEPVSAIGLSANSEGDVRPPVILGVDTRTGQVAWTTPLVDGTDLMFGTPPVRDGATVFASTLSHPGSAAEKVAHLIELANGSIRWTAGMGGGLAFSFHPTVINGPYVHLPADSEVLTVDLADGRRRWARPGSGPVLVGDQLWIMAADRSLELLDAATGDVIRTVDSPVEDPALLLDLGDDLLGIASATEFAAVDASGEVRLRGSWSGDLVDVPRFDGGVIFVATAAQALAAYSIEAA
jgi:outer membrane protein assembly factor BamB